MTQSIFLLGGKKVMHVNVDHMITMVVVLVWFGFGHASTGQ